MLRSRKTFWWAGFLVSLSWVLLAGERQTVRAGVTSEQVERAIREGVRFLKERQRPDGSWPDVDQRSPNRADEPCSASPS